MKPMMENTRVILMKPMQLMEMPSSVKKVEDGSGPVKAVELGGHNDDDREEINEHLKLGENKEELKKLSGMNLKICICCTIM
jgi:mannose/fructose/N-acetylgalactosamine-specific phosphotransferase system component IIB